MRFLDYRVVECLIGNNNENGYEDQYPWLLIVYNTGVVIAISVACYWTQFRKKKEERHDSLPELEPIDHS